MTAWLPLALPLIVSLGIIALLGLPVAFALRLRGFAVAVVAAPAAFAVIAVSSVVAPIIGIGWGFLPPLTVTAALSLILLLSRGLFSPPRAPLTRILRFWPPVLAASVGGALIAATIVLSIRSADAVSQSYDSIYHYNLLRYTLDTGNASSFAVGLLTPESPTFYPSLWNAFTALIVQGSGASIPVSTNAAVFAVAAVIWPIGAVAFVRAIVGPSLRTTIIAGTLLAAFPNFPHLFISWGVLYPNLLGNALLPFALLALLQVFNLGFARVSAPLFGSRWLLLIGSVGAATLAHPNTLFTLLAWSIVPGAWCVARAVRNDFIPNFLDLNANTRPPHRMRVVAALFSAAIFIGLLLLIWDKGQTSYNRNGEHGVIGAIIEVLGSTPRLDERSWLISALVLIGVLVAWRIRSIRWLIPTALLMAVLFVIANGFQTAHWRHLIISPWYNDPVRTAAFIVLTGMPLAALGADRVAILISIGCRRLLRAFAPTPENRALTQQFRFFAVLGMILLIAVAHNSAGVIRPLMKETYKASENSALLTPNERELISRLSHHVPSGETLLTSPYNGGSLAYALSGYEVFLPHASKGWDPVVMQLIEEIGNDSPAACELAQQLNVRYLLDFGSRIVVKNAPRAKPLEGISDIGSSPLLTEIDREGKNAVLYEITGCN